MIPDKVREIGIRAFMWCEALTSVVIPDSVTTIDFMTFHGCKKLTSVEIQNGVTEIGKGAFLYCPKLKSVVIPDSVTKIGEDAFHDCPERRHSRKNAGGHSGNWRSLVTPCNRSRQELRVRNLYSVLFPIQLS